MQDGIEFYHKKLFSKAQECFIDELKNLNEDSDRYCEVLEYLIEISKKINNKDIKVYYSKIIEFHFKKSNYTKIIKYSKQELELKAEILTIKAMYFLGMLEEFEQRTKKILETCLEEKLHSYTEELCTWLKDKKKYSLMPLFAELMVAVEVNHNSKVVEVTNFIEKLILHSTLISCNY